MNPKTIHIIWLGPKPLYNKYLPSIQKYCPKGFSIHIWRDDEVVPLCQDCDYFKKNYSLGNWAFCSDYARFKILELYGGIYIDTDVEFIKPFDELIERGSFGATEKSTKRVNTGHIIYFKDPHDPIVKSIVDYFVNEGHKWQYIADGEILAASLQKYGYVLEDKEQELSNGFMVYRGGTFDGDRNNPEPWAKAIHWYTHMWVDVRTLPENKGKTCDKKPVIS